MSLDECKLYFRLLYFKFFLRGTLIVAIIFLQSCCLFATKNQLVFSQENIPAVKKGVYYHDVIKILGANVHILSVKNHEPYNEDLQLDSGLTISTYHPESNFFIEISGVSNKVGKEQFTIVGGVSGTQCPGYQFEKTFTVITVESDQKVNTTTITPTDTKITTSCL